MVGEAVRPDGRMDERVVRALSGRPGRLAFSRLKRDLNAHPESLTRSLRRLERLGTVGHDDFGYFLVDRPEPSILPKRRVESVELASVRLPPTLGPTAPLGLLAGRWFGEVRWAGSWEEEGRAALAWEVPGVPGLLVLRWNGARVTIAAEGAGPDGPSDRLLAAADELLVQTLRRWRTVGLAGLDGGPTERSSAAVALAGSRPGAGGWAA